MSDEIKTEESRTFTLRLEFYWQFMAVYSVALIVFSLLKGSIEDDRLSLALDDPLVILFAGFILFSFFALAYNLYMSRRIIVGKDYLIFKNRIREKKYVAGDIIKIAFSKERKRHIDSRAGFKVIKIKVRNRKRVIKIRPSSFREDKEFVRWIVNLKKNLASMQ